MAARLRSSLLADQAVASESVVRGTSPLAGMEPACLRSRSVLVAVAPIVIAGGLTSMGRWRQLWITDPWARPVLGLHLMSVAACLWGGLALWRRRLGNRCGVIAMLLGADLAMDHLAFFARPATGWWPFVDGLSQAALRPLLIWLVLAWPTGKLERVGRGVMVAYLTATALFFTIDTLGRATPQAWPGDPIGLWRPSMFTRLWFSIWWDVGGLIAVAIVLVVTWRRRLRHRGQGPPWTLLGWWAALAAVAGDVVLFGLGPLRQLQSHADRFTAFGSFVEGANIARWGAVVATLAVGSRRWWAAPHGYIPDAVALDVAIAEPVAAVLGDAFGDPTVEVAVSGGEGRWVDERGRTIDAPERSEQRALTIVARNGVPIAAIGYEAGLAAHPSVIDGAAAAVGLRLDALAQRAAAEAATAELERIGHQIVDAEDSARVRLERHLHDGAQQTLLGLALEAGLALRRCVDVPAARALAAADLAAAIDATNESLIALAAGRLPALLSEQGLAPALGTLAATAGLPVTLRLDPCHHLPRRLQEAVWLTASEAVANALKHAGATHLTLRFSVGPDAVTLTVGDDGIGGMTQAPASLVRRVVDADGILHFASASGAGTQIRATFRIAVEAAVTPNDEMQVRPGDGRADATGTPTPGEHR